MTTYNYKANYEQQLQIEKLMAENEALKQRLEALERTIQQLASAKEVQQ
jgi:cell division protein FtsB